MIELWGAGDLFPRSARLSRQNLESGFRSLRFRPAFVAEDPGADFQPLAIGLLTPSICPPANGPSLRNFLIPGLEAGCEIRPYFHFSDDLPRSSAVTHAQAAHALHCTAPGLAYRQVVPVFVLNQYRLYPPDPVDTPPLARCEPWRGCWKA